MQQLTSSTKGVTTVKNFLTVLTAIALFGLVACEGPAGPAGKDGAAGAAGSPGANGVDAGFVYFDGFKADLKCATCHTPGVDTAFFVAGRVAEQANSKHSIGGDVDRNAKDCARCHTTEGLQQYVAGKPLTDILHPSAPGCFACHAPHGTGDFSLRVTNAVTMLSGVDGVADYSYTTTNKSTNMCITCHQPRAMSPKAPAYTKTAATDSLVLTNSRWYNHYGIQGPLLIGKGGYEFAGYNYPNSTHQSMATAGTLECATCHMQEPIGGGATKAGGHTMKLEFDSHGTPTVVVTACKKCHADITSSATSLTMSRTAFDDYRKASGVSRSVIAKSLDSLKTLLINKGWYDPATELVKASSSKPLVIKPAYRAGALYNFFFVEHDLSEGIHNSKYAKALLDASIAEMNKP
ncbi:MAG TPA: hypothetical protein DCQ28_04090 [Bacteroidetes bacterium]|nr:hypothetical protein [Bacteroidota bacterium]